MIDPDPQADAPGPGAPTPGEQPGPSPSEPEDHALRRLLLFQFAVLSGLFALGFPGLFVIGGTHHLHPLYYPVVGIHLFFLWRLYRFDHGMLPWIQGFCLVAVVLPWAVWALRVFLDIPWYLSAPTLFVSFILFTLWRAFPRIDAPPAG